VPVIIAMLNLLYEKSRKQ